MSRVATQLIVFGKAAQQDLAGVLAAVAEAGYDGVETGLLMEQIGGRGLGRMLERNRLGLAGCHGGFAFMENAASALDFVLEAGGRHLICSGVGDRTKGRAAYEAAADVFNRVGRMAKDRGAVFCYHNHSWEFADLGGCTGLDILYQRTDPDLVKLCIDVFWVADGGKNPAVFLHRHLKRLALVHLKDGKPGQVMEGGGREFLELGAGQLDFPPILKMLELARLEWLTVEQDRSYLPPAESVRRSRQYLRDIGC
jgi:sugar phosphate isomerase/epimerase